VVDEAIYGIRQDMMPPLLEYFFSRDYNAVSTTSSLEYFFIGQSGKRQMQLAELRARSRLAQLKPDRLVMPKIRKAFPDTAFWNADLITDANGRAQAKVEFPDSLTTWRATARGVTADTKVGAAVAKTLVRKNLILRLAVPRFFVQGDEIILSAIVHNYLPGAKTAQVSLDLKGLEVITGATKSVEIPSRGEARVDWRVRVQQVRSATIVGKALTNEESDALELTLPVDVPGVKLTEAKGGAITAGSNAAFDFNFPEKVQPASRGLSIQIAPSIAGSLFNALDFLTSFPYGCVEQTMSSFLPNVIVQSTVRDLGLGVNLDQAALSEKINAGLERLYAFEHQDGGWGWWETDETHPFMTAYVVAGLAQAESAGVNVNADAIRRGVEWLTRAYQGNDFDDNPDLRAYVAYALALAGRADTTVLNRAYGDRGHMSSYGLAVLGLALDAAKDPRAGEIAGAIEGRAQQDSQQAWWPADRDPMLDFEADTTPEATAFATKLLARQKRGAALLPKAALWLMNHRSEGYWWSSTKQTAMVIYGLTDYLRNTNELKPNLNATVFVNGRSVLTRKMDQIADANQEIKLDDAQLDPRTNHVRVEVTGEGRLYYSARSEYYSPEPKLEKTGAISLNLLRDYFRLTPAHEGERTIYDTAPLNGPVASGDILAVRLTVTGSNWKYMMIEDPIPAGTEFLASDSLYTLRNRPPWWRWEFTRRELHDDRMAIFQTFFLKGQQTYFYLLKVVNPGVFKVSPARVGPMYQPEVSATSESRVLEVK
jgi:alpha-2-macroglobulin